MSRDDLGRETELTLPSFNRVLTFAMMGGRFPYRATDPVKIAEEARTTELYFPKTWDSVSEDGSSGFPPLASSAHFCCTLTAKDFVRKLLVVDPDNRLTAAEALHHPWLLTAVSRPPSPKEEHSHPVELPVQADFINPEPVVESQSEKRETAEGNGLDAPVLERRATMVQDTRDTRVAV